MPSTLRKLMLPLLLAAAAPVAAQDDEPALRVTRLAAEPARVTVEAGSTVPFRVVAYDAAGNVVENAPLRVSGPRRAVSVDDDAGTLRGLAAGTYDVYASVRLPADSDREPPTLRVPVVVSWPGVVSIQGESPGVLYAGTTVPIQARAYHADESERLEPVFRWSSSDADVASVDRFGNVTARSAGRVTITATLDGASRGFEVTVEPFPAERLELVGGRESARTGDVLTFEPRAYDAAGRPVDGLPVTWAHAFVPHDSIHAPGAGGHVIDGRFVAEVAGQHTVLATAGPLLARAVVDVQPRAVVQEVVSLGQGQVSNVHTSELAVYEGNDGRDYAVTGTWGGDGIAYFWDVTDPTSPVKTDSVQVDARTINDVKVSPDARYAVLGREGASNRRNGVVILDLADPAHPTVASTYDEGLTGGVHNMFATEDYLFALSDGDKYVILDVTDLSSPQYVSEYDHPDSRIHDVWVSDGLAYSSEWGTGVVIVDVGNGRWGGSIENPTFVTSIPYPVGATHAAFPYHQKDTGRFYLFLGDEIMPRRGTAWSGAGLPRIPRKGGKPAATAGYIHVIDWTDPENPRDVARYQVPEFGTHNFWVEDDRLYVAYYEGGLRVVDVSGELMGDLAEQGREIAVYKAYDPQGFVANAPMAWGPQPHKGNIWFTDFNSGLWSVRLEPKREGRPAS